MKRAPMNNLIALKAENEDFAVEFEVTDLLQESDSPFEDLHSELRDNIKSIDDLIADNKLKIDEFNEEIEKYTNHADKYDYMLAVGSGILCGIIDSIAVGEWSFQKEKAIVNEDVNNSIIKFAERNGYQNRGGQKLQGAITYLENKFPLVGDNTFNGANVGINTKSHHLDDLSHHPTIVGLICSILVQFTKKTVYSNADGQLIRIPITIDENGYLEGKTPQAKLSSGILNWLHDFAKNRRGHLYSDIAGSKATSGGGMGLPGPIMSMAKELSALPIIRDQGLPKILNSLYTKGIGTGKGQVDLGSFNALFEGASSKFDYRTEKTVKRLLGKQAIPVIINEVIVRTFYFVRRLIGEIKEKGDISTVDFKKCLPFNNRTIARMLTISSGTFMAVDMLDAAVRSAIKNGCNIYNPKLYADFILRVNFVGIGRFACAVGTDIYMGYKKEKLRYERIKMYNEQLHLLNAKLFYKQADVWVYAMETSIVLNEAYDQAEKAIIELEKTYQMMDDHLKKISNMTDGIEKNNPELIDEIVKLLDN